MKTVERYEISMHFNEVVFGGNSGRQFFLSVESREILVCFGFASRRSAIGFQNLRLFLNQWEAKIKNQSFLEGLIGSLYCLRMLWFAKFIPLVSLIFENRIKIAVTAIKKKTYHYSRAGLAVFTLKVQHRKSHKVRAHVDAWSKVFLNQSILPFLKPNPRHVGESVIRLGVMNYRDSEGRLKRGFIETRKHLPGMWGLEIGHC